MGHRDGLLGCNTAKRLSTDWTAGPLPRDRAEASLDQRPAVVELPELANTIWRHYDRFKPRS